MRTTAVVAGVIMAIEGTAWAADQVKETAEATGAEPRTEESTGPKWQRGLSMTGRTTVTESAAVQATVAQQGTKGEAADASKWTVGISKPEAPSASAATGQEKKRGATQAPATAVKASPVPPATAPKVLQSMEAVKKPAESAQATAKAADSGENGKIQPAATPAPSPARHGLTSREKITKEAGH